MWFSELRSWNLRYNKRKEQNNLCQNIDKAENGKVMKCCNLAVTHVSRKHPEMWKNTLNLCQSLSYPFVKAEHNGIRWKCGAGLDRLGWCSENRRPLGPEHMLENTSTRIISNPGCCAHSDPQRSHRCSCLACSGCQEKSWANRGQERCWKGKSQQRDLEKLNQMYNLEMYKQYYCIKQRKQKIHNTKEIFKWEKKSY